MFVFSAFFSGEARPEVLQEVTVKEGDTLWGVANYYLKDPKRWPEILKFNNIPGTDQNVILPGMKLRVPILLIKEHLRAARLIYILNEVKYRRNKNAEWMNAWKDMELYNEDGLRTLRQSRAKVQFPSGELLNMDENSLIILKPEKKQEEIDLLSGGVRASRTKIITNSSIVDPKIEPRGPAPDFKTKIKEDKTTLVEVYEGVVDVTAQGRTVTLTKGFGTEVKFRQPPSLPKILPPEPELDMNADLSGKKEPKTAGNISSDSFELDISAPSGGAPVVGSSAPRREEKEQTSKILGQMINKYHVQVSTTRSFASIIYEEIKPLNDKINISFKKHNFSDGMYWYRYAFVDELGLEGRFSQPAQFVVDTVPPTIEIETPMNEEEVDTEFVSVEGKTEANQFLKINEKEIMADSSGKFITAIMPKKGRNLITLFAQDKAGNTTKKEIVVTKVKHAVKKKGQKSQRSGFSKKGSTIASISLGVLTAVVILGVLILFVQ